MFFAGKWVEKGPFIDVVNPYDLSVVGRVSTALPSDIDIVLETLSSGSKRMEKMSAYDRSTILKRAAKKMADCRTELGRLISLESGKTIAEANHEVGRSIETMELSAEEAKRISGETLPLDGAPGAQSRIGFTIRVPCGIVAAITPFNFPLNLVCHKVGPAIAAGNAVLIKPATDTPLSALRLTEILLDSGMPGEALACVTGSGAAIGKAICQSKRIRKISFTGSVEVGESICQSAGLKRITMELGSNSPLIVMGDADIDKVVKATTVTGYSLAGQVCISTQRLLVEKAIFADLIDALVPAVKALETGDPLQKSTRVGPLIKPAEAQRVTQWIDEAAASCASVIAGGEREQAMIQPALVTEVTPAMRIFKDELFGPAVAVTQTDNIDDAIQLANNSRYGLSAGIFTQDIDRAMSFVKQVHSGNLQVNWGPAWRADLMPYGGLKDSGMGKEGPKYAVEEMTELKTVVFHP